MGLIALPEQGKTLGVHLPHGVRDFRSMEEAVAYARMQMVPWMQSLARQAGAAQVEVQMHRHDTKVVDPLSRGSTICVSNRPLLPLGGPARPRASS